MAEFDLCRDKECKYACTAYDISKSCRNEEAEEVVWNGRSACQDGIGRLPWPDDDMRKSPDGDEVGKG